MSKYQLRNVLTGAIHTVDCPEASLEERQIGTGPIEPGARFRRKSKLDGRIIVEELIGVAHKPVGDYAGISKHATWHAHKSDAMGINPVQRRDAMKADEELGVKIDYDEKTGEAIFTSPGQYRRYCEAHGFFDRNGGYASPKKRDEREREILGLPQLARPPELEIA